MGPRGLRAVHTQTETIDRVDAGEGLAPLAGRARELLQPLRSAPDLALLATLLLLTAAFSREFSTGIQLGPIYVTEIFMGAMGAIALLSLGVGRSWVLLRRLPLIALGVFWLAGLIATARGLNEYGGSLVGEDIGLALYSLILPLMVLIVRDRERFGALLGVLVGCGFVAMAVFTVTYAADQIQNTADSLITVQGAAAGLYISFAVAWLASRAVQRVPTPWPLLALIPYGLVLMGLTSQRSVWAMAALALVVIAVLAPISVRWKSVPAMLGVVVLAFGIAAALQTGINEVGGGVVGSGENRATSSGEPGDSTPQLATELGSITGAGDSGESENVRWRVDYWRELLGRVPEEPLLGVGFGRPSAFIWEGDKYDFRDGDPNSPGDVTGPHNSFVHIAYRMGVPAIAAVLFLVFVALRNVHRSMREHPSREDRVALSTLTAMFAAGFMASSFNEGLTGPYLGLFFWVPLGMLLLWPWARGEGSTTPSPRPSSTSAESAS